MRASKFWDDLSGHARERKPGVWRDPLNGAVASSEETFNWLLAASESATHADARIAFRLYSGPDTVDTVASLRPRLEDNSVRGYARRLDAELGEVGIVVNNIQGASREVWQRALTLLAPLCERLGISSGDVIFDLFAGAYRRGAFGVHKDQFDVVTFVTEGHKRFVAWPYEYFTDHPGVTPGTELLPLGLKDRLSPTSTSTAARRSAATCGRSSAIQRPREPRRRPHR